MRNTGIRYNSKERMPTVLSEMAELLPPLSGEQLAVLEADLLANGCYAPVIVKEDIMSNGLCLTQNILEFPNQGNGCSLSAILIPDAPEKYFLSLEQMEKLLYKSLEGRRDTGSTTRKE